MCPTCREILTESNDSILMVERTEANTHIIDTFYDYSSDDSENYINYYSNKTYDLFQMNELKNELKNTIKLYLDMLSSKKLKKYKNCSLKNFLKIPFDRCCDNAKKDIYNIFFSNNKDIYHFAYTVNKKLVKKKTKKNTIKPRFRF
jgi:hypothetical protein